MTQNHNFTENDQPSLSRSCSLVLPGLLDMPTTDCASAFAQMGRLPEMEEFFSRAQKQAFPGVNSDAVMFALFEADLPTDHDLPVASVSYVGDTGHSASQWCLRADPVQLIPDRDQLVLMGPESLSLSQAEADQLVSELNAQFAVDGWNIEAVTPTRWYLQLAKAPGLRTYPLSQVRARAIGDYLPLGVDGKYWHRLMNEVQMVLHASVVNQERQAVGNPSVSSLWFWGGGQTPSINRSRWSKLWSDEAVSLGLATLTSTPRKGLPKNSVAWLESAISPGEHLLVFDDLSRAWQMGDMMGWAQKVQAVNREWVAPLLKALRQKEIDEFSIYTCTGERFSLSRFGLRRWWRRKKTLPKIAAQR